MQRVSGLSTRYMHCLPTMRALVILLGVSDELVEQRTIAATNEGYKKLASLHVTHAIPQIFYCE